MSMQRAKGQEVIINFTRGGILETTFTGLNNFHSEDVFDIITKGYLGEKTERTDFIFNHVKGSVELDLQTKAWYDFVLAAKRRAKGEEPDLQFSISKTIFFPNGDTPTVTFVDVAFGPMPEDAPERKGYVKVKLDWACSDTAIS